MKMEKEERKYEEAFYIIKYAVKVQKKSRLCCKISICVFSWKKKKKRKKKYDMKMKENVPVFLLNLSMTTVIYQSVLKE